MDHDNVRMKTFVSPLRAIHVSGRKKIKMANLRNLYASNDFAAVQSYLQRGNVPFATDETDRSVVARLIEDSISEEHGRDVNK